MSEERMSEEPMSEVATSRCPQCGARVDATMWNCPSCSINLYWAHQHFGEMARIREHQGLETRTSTPPFLLAVRERVHAERVRHGGDAMNKVRVIARRVMLGESDQEP